jgi:hypothetical protein
MKRGFDEHQLRGVDVAFDRPDRGGRNRRRWGSLHRISCAWVRPSDVEKRRADSIGGTVACMSHTLTLSAEHA